MENLDVQQWKVKIAAKRSSFLQFTSIENAPETEHFFYLV